MPRRPKIAALALALALALTASAAAEASGPTHWPAGPGLSGPPTARSAAITYPRWLAGVYVTEYWPVPERYFRGRRVRVAGLATPHRVDWLFSARGVTMQGTGLGLDNRFYHVNAVGRGGWVDLLGRYAPIGGFRPIFWRAGGYWRNARNTLTYPLEAGGWSNGVGVRYVPLPGVSFAPGHGRPGSVYYHSLAVDPYLIPLGSRVYVPAYRGLGGGCFIARDTGGAIRGLHIDVYRSPPLSSGDFGRSLRGQGIYVIPPGRTAPSGAPCAAGVPTTPPPGSTSPTSSPAPSSGPATGGSSAP